MMNDPRGKAFTLEMVDRVFRSSNSRAQAGRLQQLLDRFGTPSYLSAFQRFLLRTGAFISPVFPGLVMQSVENNLRRASAGVILPAEPQPLANYLARRRAAGTRVNLNLLGEAILGEQEATRRLDAVLTYLANPAINYISVKISSIFSQINLTDFDGTLAILKDRLRTLYRAAMAAGKFINLDMEEYRDLALTLAAFQQVLNKPEFQSFSAGIVLQAYLPDSWTAQQELTAWAQARVAAGGAPIKLRLVKGANLAMEQIEAEIHGWNPAPYSTKAQTDANYCRMLEFGCHPAHAQAVHLGVATHNLFDVALALILRDQFNVHEQVELEMLEGMANHQARAVQAAAGGLLVYAPIVRREDFFHAIAYLVRRLDENTAPENFLRDLFALTPHSTAWDHQRQRFEAAWRDRYDVATISNRAMLPAHPAQPQEGRFHNAPDTDWTQASNRDALTTARNQWRNLSPPSRRVLRYSEDPGLRSTSDTGVKITKPLLNEVLDTARAAQPTWEASGWSHRSALLHQCARIMEQQRFDLIAAMMHEGKKALGDGDVEVSEAIDYARYYATFVPSPRVRTTALGVVVVAPPWNFPYAIPASGVLAALMAGNAVILKPAPETVSIAQRLAEQLWQAGVPRDVLQFFPAPDGEIGKALITDPRVDAVILTGSYDTARQFLAWRPSLRLFAETSGKNAILITAQADQDLAVKDLVRSAFGHAGQKCSAASLAVIEAEVYDDPDFRRMLRDAAASLPVGPAVDPKNVVTPLIQPPGPDLLRALTTLDAGEEWLLQPRVAETDPSLWSPGIKLGVCRGSWFHRTECFGPVLGVIRANDLQDAVNIQNDSALGLTGGIHSLDEDEIAYWRQRVQVGNAYINRAITGAVVQRQPFGGWKHSCFGPGAKAGGPNYVALFMHMEDAAGAMAPTFGGERPVPLAHVPMGEGRGEGDFGFQTAIDRPNHPHPNPLPEYRARGPEGPPPKTTVTPIESYAHAWRDHFSVNRDPSALRCESNIFRYRRYRGVLLRLENDDARSLELAHLAARITGVPLHVSLGSQESEADLIARLPAIAAHAEFLRTIHPPGDALLAAAYNAGLNWINAPLLSDGRHELPRWLREQSVSETRHRYGLVLAPDTSP
jgi:RHH-type proline utilization regulon transcriptional repressor/proline dehydrogenase/delta 1-pyrroline-5-carboxylate dehydrogenase